MIADTDSRGRLIVVAEDESYLMAVIPSTSEIPVDLIATETLACHVVWCVSKPSAWRLRRA